MAPNAEFRRDDTTFHNQSAININKLPFNQTPLFVTPTFISDANSGGGTITSQAGTTEIIGITFSTVNLKIPSYSPDLPNLSGLPYVVGPGNNPTSVFLNYMAIGAWRKIDFVGILLLQVLANLREQ